MTAIRQKRGPRDPYKEGMRFLMIEAKTCRLVGYDAPTKTQILDWPNYAVTHGILAANSRMGWAGTVLRVNEVAWEVVGARQSGDVVTVDLRKIGNSN